MRAGRGQTGVDNPTDPSSVTTGHAFLQGSNLPPAPGLPSFSPAGQWARRCLDWESVSEKQTFCHVKLSLSSMPFLSSLLQVANRTNTQHATSSPAWPLAS